LVAFDAQGTAWFDAGFYRATVDFVIVSTVTP
jgi:hypothetical protein